MDANILCVVCRATFTEEQISDATCCPRCGSTGVPADLNKSVTIKLTEHELRILTIWASNYAHPITGGADSSAEHTAVDCINGILGAIGKQVPFVALTLHQEIQDLSDSLGKSVQSSFGDFEPKTRN